MSLAQHIRVAAQHDDWKGYLCPVTNRVLAVYLAAGDRMTTEDDARTFMLIVAEALDGGHADGVKGSDDAQR